MPKRINTLGTVQARQIAGKGLGTDASGRVIPKDGPYFYRGSDGHLFLRLGQWLHSPTGSPERIDVDITREFAAAVLALMEITGDDVQVPVDPDVLVDPEVPQPTVPLTESLGNFTEGLANLDADVTASLAALETDKAEAADLDALDTRVTALEAAPPGTGDVVGPASAVASRMVEFDGTTGKLIKDGGVVISAAAKTTLDDATVDAMIDTLGGAAASGTGALVRKGSPQLVTPNLDTPSAGVLTNCTGLPPLTGLTLPYAAGTDTLRAADSRQVTPGFTMDSGTYAITFGRGALGSGTNTAAPYVDQTENDSTSFYVRSADPLDDGEFHWVCIKLT